MLQHVASKKLTDISDMLTASIIRVMSNILTMMMEVVNTSEIVNFCTTILNNIPEDIFIL
jgi:hypothetical protein